MTRVNAVRKKWEVNEDVGKMDWNRQHQVRKYEKLMQDDCHMRWVERKEPLELEDRCLSASGFFFSKGC